eukprot:g19765.t1
MRILPMAKLASTSRPAAFQTFALQTFVPMRRNGRTKAMQACWEAVQRIAAKRGCALLTFAAKLVRAKSWTFGSQEV